MPQLLRQFFYQSQSPARILRPGSGPNPKTKSEPAGQIPTGHQTAGCPLALAPLSMKWVFFVPFAWLLLSLGACRDSNAPPNRTGQDSPSSSAKPFAGQYPIQAVATVGMVADIVRQVGGQHVAVNQLCGAGVDPHLYKPTRDDVAEIMAADVIFFSGLALEGKLADTLEKVSRRQPVFAVTANLPESVLISAIKPIQGQGMTPGPNPNDRSAAVDHLYDPHVWMDVSAWSLCVSEVAERLSELDPAHRQDYLDNAATYQSLLAKLHAYGQRVTATIPAERRILLTSHDAFNYFGRAYNINVQGVQGLSTESEAGLRRINELVDLLVEQQVAAVFVESSVPQKNIQALVEGVRSRGHQIQIGGQLFSDAMGSAQSYEGTYVGMLDHNLTLVTRALGGEAPADGMQGKLSGAIAE